jgi:hypothetical protein
VAPVLVDLGSGSKGVDVVPGSPPAGVRLVTCQPALAAYGLSIVVEDGYQSVDLVIVDITLRKLPADVLKTPGMDIPGVVVQWEEILFVVEGHIFSLLVSVRGSVPKVLDLRLCEDKLALEVSDGAIHPSDLLVGLFGGVVPLLCLSLHVLHLVWVKF